MNQYWWVAILLGVFFAIRLAQWFAFKRTEKIVPNLLVGADFSAEVSHDGGSTWEPSELGATGIVPSGVSWVEPRISRAAIELGNKRFGKGRNG